MYIISQKKGKILQICRIFKVKLSSQGSSSIKGVPEGGWTRLPNGLILQWGICGWGYNSYNIPFPNVALNVQLTAIGHSGEPWYNDYTYGVSNFDRNGFSVVGETNSWRVCWMAIGY